MFYNLDETLMLQLGDRCFAPFAQSLIKECLAPAVPDNKADLDSYEEIADNARKLCHYLDEIGLVRIEEKESKCPITEFVSNVDSTFADNRVAKLLEEARSLMKCDLHNVDSLKETSVISDEEFKACIAESAKLNSTVLSESGFEQDFSVMLDELGGAYGFSPIDSVFKFPACQVSQHVLKVGLRLSDKSASL